MGDGDIHINVLIPGHDNKDLFDRVSTLVHPFVMDFIRKSKGSIAAEHGIGGENQLYLPYSKSKEMIDVMKMIKHGMDPNGIMNPYKLFL